MATDLPAHAFGHTLAVTGRADAATDAAVTAVTRGGRSLVSVLANARHAALSAAGPSAGSAAGEVTEGGSAHAADLAEVAGALAASRPAVERCIVDLDSRHGLDRASLGRVLGLPATEAARRATAVGETWARELDPALVVWLGPGDCDQMAALLSDRGLGPESSVADALGAASTIADHEETCEMCADRRRARVSVRSLLANQRLPDPPVAVTAAASQARRRPAAAPPPIEVSRRPIAPRLLLAAAIVVVVASIGGVAAVMSSDRDGGDGAVDRLTQIHPAGSTLALSPELIDPSTSSLRLENTSQNEVRWQLQADVPWLELSPRSGRLAPGKGTVIAVRMTGRAPEGGLRATITASGSDGSTAGAIYTGTLERAPDVSASRTDCQVTATAEDDGRVVSATLRWSGAMSGQQPMARSDERWVGSLPAEDVDLEWWVEAVDDRGNPARSETQTLPAQSCPATP